MSKFIFSLIVATAFIACESDPAQPDETSPVTVQEFAKRLRAWSNAQPRPFVIAGRGTQPSGSLGFEGNLVTNIVVDYDALTWTYTDSLRIDTLFAKSFAYGFTIDRLTRLIDSASLPLSEQQMIQFLDGVGLKLRMMRYDSANYRLAYRLWQWSNARYPTRVIRTGWYMLTYEGPNSGGYSRAFLRHEAFQNIQFLTRAMDSAAVATIADSVTTTQSEERLAEILLPIGTVHFYTTTYASD